MTRTVADTALLMSVISGPDRRDHMSLPPAAIAWSDLDRPVRGLRIGLMLEAGVGHAPEPEVVAAVEAAARAIRAGGRDRHADAALPHPGDARRARRFLARALLGRHVRAAARAPRPHPALYPRLGGARRRVSPASKSIAD